MSTLAGYEALRLCHSNWYFLRIYAFSICFQLICSFFNQLPLFSTHMNRFPSVPRFSAYSGSFVLSGSYIFVWQLFLLHIYTFFYLLHVLSPHMHVFIRLHLSPFTCSMSFERFLPIYTFFQLIHMFSSHFRLFSVFESFCNIFCSLYVTQLVNVISGVSFRSC